MIDTLFSIKNDTDAVETCISKINGENLCTKLDQIKIGIYINLVTMILWLALKSIVVKK